MNIIVVNRKGGSGKTTLCDELLFSFERSGTSAAYIDLDNQASSIHQDTSDTADATDVAIIDTPGALSIELRQWLSDADVIIIPTLPDARGMVMFLDMLDAAKTFAPDTPRILVVNKFNRYRAAQEFMEALKDIKEAGETILTLPQSETFQRAFSNDISVVEEAPKTSSALLMLRIINAVRAAAGFEPDPTPLAPIEEALERQRIRMETLNDLKKEKAHEQRK